MSGASRGAFFFKNSHYLVRTRSFQVSFRRLINTTPLPTRKPMGAFRGGLYGFLFGCVFSGGAVYSYLLQEYKASNDLLTDDIYVCFLLPYIRRMGPRLHMLTKFKTLQSSVNCLANYVKTLEEKTK